MSKSELIQVISRNILLHIADLKANPHVSCQSPLTRRLADIGQLFPFDDRVGEQWRLGQGLMNFEYMMITQLNNISPDTWSPEICVEYPLSVPSLPGR